MRHHVERLALAIFAIYLALIPGSSVVVALDIVPHWGLGFGSVLLLLQGAAMLAWLCWRYGRRGGITALVIAALGFLVEYIGATSGLPFGRYSYTELVQPQILGVVPVAICAAWMMTAVASYEIARQLVFRRWGFNTALLLAATLVLIQDLQIETVAALVNHYWTWTDSGFYYGVPTANFVAWWLVGLAMTWLIWRLLDERHIGRAVPRVANDSTFATMMNYMPHMLYLLSSAMFTVINLARGYLLAGLIGVTVLLVAGAITGYGAVLPRQIARRRFD